MLLSTVLVIWGLKYLILVPGNYMAELGHPQGTCVLFEIPSLISLVHYFQSIHHNEIFEIKGVRINQVENSTLSQTNTFGMQNFNLNCAVTIYSLCYSMIKSYSYWNSNTLTVIVNNGK